MTKYEDSSSLLGECVQAFNEASLIDIVEPKADSFGEARMLQDTERGALYVSVVEAGEVVNLVKVEPEEAIETFTHAHALRPAGEIAIRQVLIDITSPQLAERPLLLTA